MMKNSDRYRFKDHIKDDAHDSSSFLEKQTNEQLISLIKDLAQAPSRSS